MTLKLGMQLGLGAKSGDPYAFGRDLSLDIATGAGLDRLSITSASSGGSTGPLVEAAPVGGNVVVEPKAAGGLAGMRKTPGSDTLWLGPLAAATTLVAYSKPVAANGWTIVGTDGGDVSGPGTAGGARRITGDGSRLLALLAITFSATKRHGACLIKGTSGKHLWFDNDQGDGAHRKKMVFNGSWQLFELPNPGGTADNAYIYIDTWDRIFATDPGDPSQTVDIALVQVSDGPFPLIETNGANLTRLAETVTVTTAAYGADCTAMAELSFAAGLPIADVDLLTSGADKLTVTTAGKLKPTDGTLTTTSTAGMTAAAGQKVGVARGAADSTLRIVSTYETGAAVNWGGNTTWTLGGPIQKLRMWPTRRLTQSEMAGAI